MSERESAGLAGNQSTESAPEGAPLAGRYDPFAVEGEWVRRWAEEPFTADAFSSKEPFTIVIPPPNVTGNLHLGHAFDNTIIDTLIRFKRMQGYEALFQPGTDHAGISTQVVVERELRKEGTSRFELGRERFLERVWEWKEKYGGIILEQLQRLGVSADWSRTRFTMDEGLSRAVRRQFVELYHKGLVYRGERIVNWDPASRTVLSDLEVDREERPGKLYHLAYELEGGGEIVIATVRPETIFADVAIALHPDDPRAAALEGKRARIPLTERYVPVILDEAVELGFGTGALKITPAHDPTDFEIGERHGLPRPSVIDLDARLTGELVPEGLRGLDRFEARKRVVPLLEEAGALRAVEDHTVSLGISERTKEPVEPILSLQWFYDTDEAAKRALAALDAGEIEVHPERFTKVNRDWLANLRHWCISRQLWWGHRIPAWYDAEGNVYVPPLEDPDLDPTDDPRYQGLELTQDEDVFDTWFSSNLWPFSTLGWPDTEDPFYKKFYPTDVLVTGYDIIFFWVARMQLAAYQFTGQRPFKDVLLHGLVVDAQGQKMSKSRGNGVDPLDMIERYGADALRFVMGYVATGGQDIRWDERRVEMGRNYANKLWNAARFAMMHLDLAQPASEPAPERLADRWILSRLARTVEQVTADLEAYDLGAATRHLYDFAWSEFCDWYLEAAKAALNEGDASTKATLRYVLEAILKLQHPLMPFVTSELYRALGNERQLALAEWPQARAEHLDPAAEREFAHLQAAVGAVRSLRSDAEAAPSARLEVHLDGPGAARVRAVADLFEALARARLLEGAATGPALSQAVPELEVTLPLAGQVDVAEYRARQQRRLQKLAQERERSAKKLANERFTANAPAEVVEEERRRLAEADDVIARVSGLLAQLERTAVAE
ncbi:MAG: valine--tRNA ligase [Deinococcales bacterium]|nr:valine--tRNA ligase [Deinococcales bacterium]